MSIKEKRNANVVGANCIRPHFEGMTQNKGITLIALIITIIVMLILVGVTINVALNGGLFEKAETATRQTQKEVDKEALLVAIVGAIKRDGTVDFEILDKNLPTEEWSGEDGIYTSPKGNTFTVDENGKITEGGTSSGGENGEKPGEGDSTELVLPVGLTVGSEFEMDADQNGTAETWIVLHAGTEANSHLNENEIEAISKNVMGETLTLGSGDETAQTPGDIDSDGTANSDIDKAIYSFENSINRLNSYCEGLIKIENNGVRSVGSKPSDKSYMNTANTQDSVVTHLAEWTDAGRTAWNKYKLLAGTGDTNYSTDYIKMNTLGIKVANNNEGTATVYWLASRDVSQGWDTSSSSGSMRFGVGYIRKTDGARQNHNLWSVYYLGRINTTSPAYAVRPVVKLQYP